MDLKEFIKETITALVEATVELQSAFEEKGVIINPPLSNIERDLYEHGTSIHRYRRVEAVEFDLAVTVGSETAGGAKAGLKVFAAEFGADGKHVRRNEEVSRVKFSIPVVLSPAGIERANKELAADEETRKAGEHAAAQADWKPRKVY